VIRVDQENPDTYIDLKQYLPEAHREDSVKHIQIKYYDLVGQSWKGTGISDNVAEEMRPLVGITDSIKIKVQAPLVKAA